MVSINDFEAFSDFIMSLHITKNRELAKLGYVLKLLHTITDPQPNHEIKNNLKGFEEKNNNNKQQTALSWDYLILF